MSKLVLSFDHLVQILGDASFYTRCPVYLFMQDHGLESYNAYMAAVSGKTKPGCKDCRSQPSDKQLIQPAVLAFVQHTVKLSNIGADQLKPLKDYLAARLRKPVDQVVLYYGHKGHIKNLTF